MRGARENRTLTPTPLPMGEGRRRSVESIPEDFIRRRAETTRRVLRNQRTDRGDLRRMELQHVLAAVRTLRTEAIAIAHDRAQRMSRACRGATYGAGITTTARFAVEALVDRVGAGRRAAVGDVRAVRMPRTEIVTELVSDDARRKAHVDARIREDLVDAVASALRLRLTVGVDPR